MRRSLQAEVLLQRQAQGAALQKAQERKVSERGWHGTVGQAHSWSKRPVVGTS